MLNHVESVCQARMNHLGYLTTAGLRPAKCIGDSFPDGIRLPLFGQDLLGPTVVVLPDFSNLTQMYHQKHLEITADI